MRDFAEICGISLPSQIIEYKTFVEMARSKVLRLNTKIQILSTAKTEEDESLSSKYRKPEPVAIGMFKSQQVEKAERIRTSNERDSYEVIDKLPSSYFSKLDLS